MSSASGLTCDVDPTLINALRQQKIGKYRHVQAFQ